MHPVSDDLHQLIHSLNSAELRYYKVQTSRESKGGESQFLKLFEAIEAQETYDETALLQTFQGTSIAKNLASVKYQLYQQVLRRIRTYHSGRNSNWRLREMVDEIELLYFKELYSACAKMIRKALKLAQKYDNFAVIAELSAWERRLLLLEKNRNIQEELSRLLEREKLALDCMTEEAEYSHHYSKLYILSRIQGSVRSPEYREKLVSIVKECIRENEFPNYFRAQLEYYRIQGVFSDATGDHQSSYLFFNENLLLWEKNPHQIEEHPYRYLEALANFQAACLNNARHEDFLRSVAKMRQFQDNPNIITTPFISRALSQELIYSLNFRNYEQTLEVIREIEQYFEKHLYKIDSARVLTMFYNISIFFFLNGKYSNALKWINRFLNLKGIELKQDLQDFARLFQLIVHHELGNHDLLDYLQRSVTRYLQSREKVHEYERIILRYIRESGRLRDESEFQTAFGRVRNELEDILQNSPGRRLPGVQELLFWVESKLRRIPIQDYYHEKLAER